MSTRCLDPFLKFAMLIAFCSLLCAPVQAQQSSAAPLTKAQLEQLVAPIALHPDPLLSQMLMASTYPTEVVQAARWAKEHPGVSGTALEDAMQKQAWDPSVKALTAVPQALQMMNDKLAWTQQLGDAFLAQQEDLLAAVQRLRQRAEAAGNLKTTEQQTVKTVQAPTAPAAPTGPGAPAPGSTAMIAIEPTNPEYLYVPVYDPRVVYGDWPYPEYEPYYWYPAGFTGGGVLAFASAVAIGSAIWGNFDWWRNRVDVNVNRFNQFNRTKIADNTWRHNPRHRGNVPYRDAKVGQRFGEGGRAAARDAYRGKADAGRRDLAKAKVGDGSAKAKVGQGAGKAKAAQGAAKAKAAHGGAAAKAKAAHGGAAAKAKSAAAGHGKHAAAAKSAATRAQGAQNARNRAGGHGARQAASRPRASAHRPQMRGYSPMGGGNRPAFRGGGGHRVGMRGGGGFRGGGGRGGGRRR